MGTLIETPIDALVDPLSGTPKKGIQYQAWLRNRLLKPQPYGSQAPARSQGGEETTAALGFKGLGL